MRVIEEVDKLDQGSGFDILDGMIEDLQRLNHSTEEDFLRIGGELMEFLQEAESISSGLTSLTELISGEQGTHAASVLTHALERCSEMEASAVERSRNLLTLQDGARSVRSTFSSFDDFLSTLRTLCTLTRIETARLGGEGNEFSSLTEDVKSLRETMASKVANVLNAAMRLGQQVELTVRSLSDVNVLLKDLSQGIAGVISSLDTFSDQQAEAANLSDRLATDSRSISASIKNAVMSIQFHDITRQRTEHVIEALQHVSSISRSHGPSFPHRAGAVLALQAAQLSNTEETFGSSVDFLLRDLQNIVGCVREMTTASSGLLVISGGEQNSFFIDMERCLTTTLDALGSHQQAVLATDTAAGEWSGTLGFMQRAAQEIRHIDSDMHILALNTRVQAARLGESGKTLSILAGALKDLAMTCRQRSDDIGQALDSMSAGVARLSQKGEPSASTQMPSQQDSLVGEMRSTIKELHSWSEVSSSRINETTAIASRLCEAISAAQVEFAAGRLFDEVATRCSSNLMTLAAEVESIPAEEDSSVFLLDLENFAKRYTMQSERDVHAAVTQTANFGPSPSGAVNPLAVSPEENDSDDNFELF